MAESAERICGECGSIMERKCFKGGFAPIWRCRNCEYASRLQTEKEK